MEPLLFQVHFKYGWCLMPKYTETPAGSIPDPRWLKRIANEAAETNRILRKIRKSLGNQADPLDSDDAGS